MTRKATLLGVSDLTAVLLIGIGVAVAVTGGFRAVVAGVRISMTDPYRWLVIACVVIVVRHVVTPRPNVWTWFRSVCWRKVAGFAAYGLPIGVFVFSIGQFFDPETGFTRLIEFGDEFEPYRTAQVRGVPHYVVPDSSGYDGQFYAEIALDPLARNPELATALDAPGYRARRMLFAWTAFLLGLGQPSWVLQAYALQNVLCWLLLAWLLMRWSKPFGKRGVFVWIGCLFSGGLLGSVRKALLDGPSLLLIVAGIWAVERGRMWLATGVLGMNGLGRETNLLSGGLLMDRSARNPRGRGRLVVMLALMLLPLSLWTVYLVSVRHLEMGMGVSNVGWPLSSYVTKWVDTLGAFSQAWKSTARFSLAALVSLTTQAAWLLVQQRWNDAWWRVGATYAALMLVLGPSVWSGDDLAAPRVLLPMTVAYNLLLPTTRWFWPLWTLGNLTILYGLEVLRVPYLSGYLGVI